ncbi:MAG: YbjN domain-containing protein [Bacillota bacterium]|jgi:hypothetical protein
MLILETVCEYLDNERWSYHADRERSLVFFDVAGEKGTMSCAIVVDEGLRCLTFLIQLGVTVPGIKRLRMSDFITRVNYALLLGCFELNVDSGDMRFRVSLPLADAELSRQQLRDIIATGIYTVDRYYPGVMMLIYKNATAAEAYNDGQNP